MSAMRCVCAVMATEIEGVLTRAKTPSPVSQVRAPAAGSGHHRRILLEGNKPHGVLHGAQRVRTQAISTFSQLRLLISDRSA